MLARGRSGQKWPEGCIQGAFISARGRSGQRSKWPEVEVARGRSGQRLKWPEVEVARGRGGQGTKWPEDEVAKGRSGQRTKWPEDEVARGRSGQRTKWPGDEVARVQSGQRCCDWLTKRVELVLPQPISSRARRRRHWTLPRSKGGFRLRIWVAHASAMMYLIHPVPLYRVPGTASALMAWARSPRVASVEMWGR